MRRKMVLIKLNRKTDSYCHIVGKFRKHIEESGNRLEALNDVNHTYKHYIDRFGEKLRRAYVKVVVFA